MMSFALSTRVSFIQPFQLVSQNTRAFVMLITNTTYVQWWDVEVEFVTVILSIHCEGKLL